MGTKEEFLIDVRPDLGGEFELKSSIKGRVVFMAMHDEIHVEVHDLETSISGNCGKCLKKYSQKIEIPLIEREFFPAIPKNLVDQEDIFLINKKDMTIDLSEVLRQEILLHFPLIPVCSKSCKGLCPKCGIDLNKKTCKCSKETVADKPLAILKQFK